MKILGVVYREKKDIAVDGYILEFSLREGPVYENTKLKFDNHVLLNEHVSFSPETFYEYWRKYPCQINYDGNIRLTEHIKDGIDYQSISLSAFFTPLTTNNEENRMIVCATGLVIRDDDNNIVVGAVGDIQEKYDIYSTWVKERKNDNENYAFVYVSDNKINFKNLNAKISLLHFAPKTIIGEIEYKLKNSIEILEKQKHIYAKLLENELQENKNSLEQMDFYFLGDKSSRLLFDPLIFRTINGIITENSKKERALNFHTLEYYASQQRMDGQKKIPTWINNFLENKEDKKEYNYSKINEINDSLSIFAHNLEPQFEMLIDTILKTNAKTTLKHFESDHKDFFKGYDNENYKTHSAIIITYKDKPSWMCYSEVEKNGISRICITKSKEETERNEIINAITDLFRRNLEKDVYALSERFKPFVLIAAPGTGKTETTKFFARMENIENNDSEAEKVFSSDDRINNRAYSDNPESKLFRDKFDWAYPSREEAKNRIKQLVKEKYKNKEGDGYLEFLKNLVGKLYRDKQEFDEVINESNKAHELIDKNKDDLKNLNNLFKGLYGNEKIINGNEKIIENQLKEVADKNCQKGLQNLLDEYYINKYREIEYNIRKNQVLDSIDLAWIQHQRLDLGGKEIMEPSVRKNLYLRGYKSILLINAKQPFKEKKDTEGEKDSIEALGLKENSWSCVKQNLNVIEKAENNKYFTAMRDNAFEAYFDEVYEEHPETADEAPRRNIFNLKNEALGGKCKNCERASCDKECEYWTEENIKKFKESLKKDIWDPRFRYYLDYCQEIVVRQKTIEETANMVNSIVGSSEYKSNLVKKIPAAYCNNDSNSFAEYTVKNRFHEIWEAEFKDTNWNEFVEKKKVSDFIKNTRGDLKEYLNNFSDSTLQQFFNNAEFLKSEFFLYHIMKEKWELEKKDIRDLFKLKKQNDWEKKRDDKLIPKLRKIIFQTSSLNKQKIDGYLNYMTTGNAHDLSQRQSYKPKSEDSIKLIYDGITPIEDAENKHIYEEVFSFFNKRKYKRFDFIPDNAGVELFSDYLFALYLLQTNTVEKIVLHLKPFPMFVSDATASDFETLKTIIEGEFPEISTMLTQYESEGRLVIKADEEEFFYVPYFKDCKFVEEIMKAGCELLIVKGDLNYRRLVGDLNWDRTQPIKPIIAPFVTCKCLCLRCIKSDVLLGLTEADAEQVKNTIPPEELPKGKYATIQFI